MNGGDDMHITNGNNALALTEPDIVEELTAYSDKELSLLVESAYDLGIRHEKAIQRRIAKRKRKERVESIKLTIVLFIGMVGLPAIMFLHWIVVGY